MRIGEDYTSLYRLTVHAKYLLMAPEPHFLSLVFVLSECREPDGQMARCSFISSTCSVTMALVGHASPRQPTSKAPSLDRAGTIGFRCVADRV